MADQPIYKYEIKIINSDGISLDSVVRAPRVYKPQDLQAACANTEIICHKGESHLAVESMVRFLLGEFFLLSHRTGLYNRQKSLWESLSKVASVSVFQLKKGLFRRQAMPFFDLHFQDHRGRTFMVGHLVDSSFVDNRNVLGKALISFLSRVEKLSGLTGIFLCLPKPFPQAILDKVSKLTGATDPVGRYESILPPPWSAAIDLLEISADSANGATPEPAISIRLIHPDLTVTKRIRAAAIKDDAI